MELRDTQFLLTKAETPLHSSATVPTHRRFGPDSTDVSCGERMAPVLEENQDPGVRGQPELFGQFWRTSGSTSGKKLPARTADSRHCVRSWSRKDPVEMKWPSSIHAWESPKDRGASRSYSPWGHKDSDMTGICHKASSH